MSVREDVLADIKSTLEGITTGNGYNHDVAAVVRGEVTPTMFKAFPVITFDDIGESYDRKNNHSLHKELRVAVLGLLRINKHTGDDAVRAAASNLLADIEKALMQDRCRGGNAIDTLLKSNDIESGEATSPYAFVVLELVVTYRTNLTDPTSIV